MSVLEQPIEQKAQLLRALGATTRTVKFEDREVERFSPRELLEAIAGLDQQIATLTGSDNNGLFVVASSSGLSGCNVPCCHGDVRDDRNQPWGWR